MRRLILELTMIILLLEPTPRQGTTLNDCASA